MLRNNADVHISSLGYMWFYQSQLGDCMSIPGTISALPVIENAATRNKPYTRNQFASEWVKKISKGLSTENYIIQIILYILSFNYSNRYETSFVRILYAANSPTLHCKGNQYLVNASQSGLRYSKQIEFQEELMNFLTTWSL